MQNQETIIAFLKESQLVKDKLTVQEFVIFLEMCEGITENPNVLNRIISIFKTYSYLEKEKIQKLSGRQLQIYNLIGESMSSQEIALRLDISIATVATHRKNMIKKLGLKGSGQLQRHSLLYGTSSSVKNYSSKTALISGLK